MSPAGMTCGGSGVMSKDGILGHPSLLVPGLGRNNVDSGGLWECGKNWDLPFFHAQRDLAGIAKAGCAK